MNHYRDKRRVRREFIPLIIVGAAALVFLFSWIVMLLWNAILPELVNVRQINIWQAMGLLVLSKILFGGFGKSGGWNRRKERSEWSNMTPEERTRFKEEWKRRCYPGSMERQSRESGSEQKPDEQSPT